MIADPLAHRGFRHRSNREAEVLLVGLVVALLGWCLGPALLVCSWWPRFPETRFSLSPLAFPPSLIPPQVRVLPEDVDAVPGSAAERTSLVPEPGIRLEVFHLEVVVAVKAVEPDPRGQVKLADLD